MYERREREVMGCRHGRINKNVCHASLTEAHRAAMIENKNLNELYAEPSRDYPLATKEFNDPLVVNVRATTCPIPGANG